MSTDDDEKGLKPGDVLSVVEPPEWTPPTGPYCPVRDEHGRACWFLLGHANPHHRRHDGTMFEGDRERGRIEQDMVLAVGDVHAWSPEELKRLRMRIAHDTALGVPVQVLVDEVVALIDKGERVVSPVPLDHPLLNEALRESVVGQLAAKRAAHETAMLAHLAGVGAEPADPNREGQSTAIPVGAVDVRDVVAAGVELPGVPRAYLDARDRMERLAAGEESPITGARVTWDDGTSQLCQVAELKREPDTSFAPITHEQLVGATQATIDANRNPPLDVQVLPYMGPTPLEITSRWSEADGEVVISIPLPGRSLELDRGDAEDLLQQLADALGRTGDEDAGGSLSRLADALGYEHVGEPLDPDEDAETIRAVVDVIHERAKQLRKWPRSHDDEHSDGSIANVAAMLAHADRPVMPRIPSWGPPLADKHGRREQLVVAAAMLVAEIERLDRAESRMVDEPHDLNPSPEVLARLQAVLEEAVDEDAALRARFVPGGDLHDPVKRFEATAPKEPYAFGPAAAPPVAPAPPVCYERCRVSDLGPGDIVDGCRVAGSVTTGESVTVWFEDDGAPLHGTRVDFVTRIRAKADAVPPEVGFHRGQALDELLRGNAARIAGEMLAEDLAAENRAERERALGMTMSVTIGAHLASLAGTLLHGFSTGSQNPNLRTLTAGWTLEQQQNLIRAYHEFNGDPEEIAADLDDLSGLDVLPDWAIAAWLAFVLRGGVR